MKNFDQILTQESARPQPPLFTKEQRLAAKSRMLNLIKNPPKQALRITDGAGTISSNKAAFLKYFSDTIWPHLEKRDKLHTQVSSYHTILDRALYDGDQERDQWIQEKNKLENELQHLSTDPQWQENAKKFASLATGLTGQLPDFARRVWEDIELAEFSEKERPLLERLTELTTEISQISNTSEIVPLLADNERQSNDTVKSYFGGKTNFDETWRKLETLQKASRTAHGQDVAKKAEKQLNECAIIRTKLAQSKGFNTWAEFVLAQQARHYSKGMKTPKERIDFLKNLLAVTEKPYVKFLEKQLKTIQGPSLENLRRSQLSLLRLEDETLVRDYFPIESIERTWAQCMLDSGFSQWALDCVELDGFPRPKKYTHAYMNNVSSHAPKEFTVSNETLNVLAPQDEGQWLSSKIFVVQNYRDDGPLAWTTAWHEGGHAMDFVHQQDLLGYGAAYGFVETHSMTMEKFFEDVEYLTTIGRTRSGKPLEKSLAEKYILHSTINSLSQLRVQASYALFDILIWNEAYEDQSNKPSSKSFVDHSIQTFGELLTNATKAKGFTLDGIDWRMSCYATGHFYSGDVRYFGYIVADMASQLTADSLWEKLEKQTGRRTLHKQKSIAPMLIEAYYKNGFLKEFPQSVEDFTGGKFSAEAYVKNIIDAVDLFTNQTH